MKIVHMCLGCFFPDNYSYQENMLPKFHKELGYEVEVIASLMTFDKDGKSTFLKKGVIYQNEYDIKVTRLDYKTPLKVYRKLKRYNGTIGALEKAKPDILFIHGCQFMDIDETVKYVKSNPGVKVYVDNHADFSNSARNWFSKNILHKMLWRYTAHIIEPYTSKFYGVLPARVDFLEHIYNLPKDKCELLVMGADDDKVEAANRPEIRKEIREKYGITKDDFLIMTGGKIDSFKTQTLLLMEAVAKIKNPKVKLLVFGSVTPDLKERFNKLCVEEKVIYVGWVKAENSYSYLTAADLLVFPGRHSVFWEQACGQGKPMLVKYWDGTTHVDLGGNIGFLYKDSANEIYEKIKELTDFPEKFEAMKAVAESKGMEVFSYKKIAERCLQ
ncbi:glycosyltransferase family 4 protein [Lacrimispora amygdalina]|uniref:glycosyltransferase family 4 protein n=1 Tax=Lacrimispora amygdalina TaxID=253257 RepID=UPI000BE48AAB|nr:glycosyltransferase family 4 protein [Lacrimispora amygdalina]